MTAGVIFRVQDEHRKHDGNAERIHRIMSDNTTIATEFARAWMGRDLDAALRYVADDVVLDARPGGSRVPRRTASSWSGSWG